MKPTHEPSPTADRAAPAQPLARADARSREGAAARALAEAEERRRRADPQRPREIGGREGPEPVRYGDWEVKGLATDF